MQTLIEANVDVKTTDGFLLRVFCIGFTKKRQFQIKKTCYAQSAQVSFQLTIHRSATCHSEITVSLLNIFFVGMLSVI